MDTAKRRKSIAYMVIVASAIYFISASVHALSQDPPNYGILIVSLLIVIGLNVFVNYMKFLQSRNGEINYLEEEPDSDRKENN